jgi:hypothetical protein
MEQTTEGIEAAPFKPRSRQTDRDDCLLRPVGASRARTGRLSERPFDRFYKRHPGQRNRTRLEMKSVYCACSASSPATSR